MKKKHLQLLLVLAWMLFTFWLWSSPYHDQKQPYGEFDAISHWEVGDYMAVTDKPILDLPKYIALRYGGDNEYRPGSLWYHPPYHTNFAIVEIFGGDRYIPTYILNTLLSISFVLILFYIMNHFFGFWAGFGSMILASFSTRDYLVYLWGQWPERISYAFTGIILLAYYLYIESYLRKDEQPKYFFLMAILLAINMYLHPMGFFHSSLALVLFTVFLFAREKRFPFAWKTLGIGIVITLVLLAIFPFQTGSVVQQFLTKGQGSASEGAEADYGRLLHWFEIPAKNVGVPNAYFDFGIMHGSWTIPFILLGLFFCLLIRDRKHLMFLAWTVAIYLVIHADVIGKGPFVHRSLSASAHIFIPLTIIGFYYLITTAKQLRIKGLEFVKPVLVIAFIALAFTVNAQVPFNGATNTQGQMVIPPLIGAYGGPARMNDAQLAASDWMLANLPKDANVTSVGLFTLKRAYWIAGASHHINIPYAPKTAQPPTRAEMYDYMYIDYSDLKNVVGQDILNQFVGWESTMLQFDELQYNQNDIRIYKVNKDIDDQFFQELAQQANNQAEQTPEDSESTDELAEQQSEEASEEIIETTLEEPETEDGAGGAQ